MDPRMHLPVLPVMQQHIEHLQINEGIHVWLDVPLCDWKYSQQRGEQRGYLRPNEPVWCRSGVNRASHMSGVYFSQAAQTDIKRQARPNTLKKR